MQTQHRRLALSQAGVSSLAFLFLLLLTFALPYAFPVAPTVSLSYVTHFSNRAAVLLFALAGCVFAYVSPWAKPGFGKDSRLPLWLLVLGVLCSVCWCTMRVVTPPLHFPGGEAYYNLDRLHHTAAGEIPYRQFEYAYGPLLLYGPYWISKCTGLPLLGGYYIFWGLEWAVGTALLWYAVRHMAVANRARWLLFVLLWLNEIPAMLSEGISYTSLRMLGAAGIVIFAHRVWLRSRSGWRLAGTCLLLSAVSCGVALELGVSLFAGFGAWLLLLLVRGRLQRGPLLGYVAGTVLFNVLAWRLGMYATMVDFGKGAFSFPLVMSWQVLLLLALYLASLCAAAKDVKAGQWDAQSLPLVLVMLACLPAAFGRCDMGHLQFAGTGIVLGLFAILAMARPVRYIWAVPAFVVLLLPTLRFDIELLRHDLRMLRRHDQLAANLLPPPDMAHAPLYPGSGAPYAAHLPLPQGRYFSPLLWPAGTSVSDRVQIETGYYAGLTNVFSPDAIVRKLNELKQHREVTLLLEDTPLQQQFNVREDRPEILRSLYSTWYLPPARNAPVTYAPIADFIRANYVLTQSGDGLGLWRPLPRKALPALPPT